MGRVTAWVLAKQRLLLTGMGVFGVGLDLVVHGIYEQSRLYGQSKS